MRDTCGDHDELMELCIRKRFAATAGNPHICPAAQAVPVLRDSGELEIKDIAVWLGRFSV